MVCMRVVWPSSLFLIHFYPFGFFSPLWPQVKVWGKMIEQFGFRVIWVLKIGLKNVYRQNILVVYIHVTVVWWHHSGRTEGRHQSKFGTTKNGTYAIGWGGEGLPKICRCRFLHNSPPEGERQKRSTVVNYDSFIIKI